MESGSCSAKKQPAINQAVDELTKMISVLEEELHALAQRLDPVSRPVAKTPGGEDRNKKEALLGPDRESASPMTNTIHILNRRLAGLVGFSAGLRDGLEI
jgi:hypothetical protein